MKKNNMVVLFLVSILIIGAASSVNAQTLRYFNSKTSPSEVAVDELIIERFEAANPGVKVEVIRSGFDDLLVKLAAMMNSGTAPDVAFFGPRYVDGLVQQGMLLELEDVFSEIGDIPAEFVTPTSVGGIYDIPLLMQSEALYYRIDLFEEAGIEPPTTFDEWVDAARKLTDPDRNLWGISIQGLAPENGVRFANMLWANGADYFDENGNVAIDSPAAIEALEFWGELAKYAPPGVSTAGNDETAIEFAQGLTAMIKYPGRIMSYIDRYNPDLRDKIGVVAPPVGPSNTTGKPSVWTPLNNFVVFSSAENPSLAKEFVKFYMADEQYIHLISTAVPGHALPVRSSWMESEEFFTAPQIAPWRELVEQSMALGFEYGTDFALRSEQPNPHVGYAVGSPVYTSALNSFLSGQISAEEALRNVAREWRLDYGIN